MPGWNESSGSIITGQHPHSNGVTGLSHRHKHLMLSPFKTTLAEVLSRSGYNTAFEGNRMLQKLFYSQSVKPALIIDERYNGGGFIPDVMIGLLSRSILSYWGRRGLIPNQTPGAAHEGPKAMLINHGQSDVATSRLLTMHVRHDRLFRCFYK